MLQPGPLDHVGPAHLSVRQRGHTGVGRTLIPRPSRPCGGRWDPATAYYLLEGCHKGCFPRGQRWESSEPRCRTATVRMTGSAAALVSRRSQSASWPNWPACGSRPSRSRKWPRPWGRADRGPRARGSGRARAALGSNQMDPAWTGPGCHCAGPRARDRAGKQPGGTAAREAKLVLVWTGETHNKQGRPGARPGLGQLLGRHRERRRAAATPCRTRRPSPGVSARGRAARLPRRPPSAHELGDGAAWIWNLSSEQFPGAIMSRSLAMPRNIGWEAFSKFGSLRPGRVEPWARCDQLERGVLDHSAGPALASRQLRVGTTVRRLRRANRDRMPTLVRSGSRACAWLPEWSRRAARP